MGRLGEQAAHRQRLREWLQGRLPAELAAQVTGVAAHADELVILASSAAWGVRLRYAAPDLREALGREHPEFARVTVRVAPQTG